MIPRFYGSFSLELSVTVSEDDDKDGGGGREQNKTEEKTREVRLILTERINGRCMQDLNAADFSQQQRQRLMAGLCRSPYCGV